MNSTITEIYLPDDIYEAVVHRLVDVMPLLGSRDDLVSRLGEIANIWPERVRPSDREEEFLRAA
ncbi:hypothetical protein B5K11_10500 [Rhizobium leguminosarum bv. trifolii]|nr:hypothetical protein B5K11_10500 [Rhizobium leguminosarum bv. trifolii]